MKTSDEIMVNWPNSNQISMLILALKNKLLNIFAKSWTLEVSYKVVLTLIDYKGSKPCLKFNQSRSILISL